MTFTFRIDETDKDNIVVNGVEYVRKYTKPELGGTATPPPKSAAQLRWESLRAPPLAESYDYIDHKGDKSTTSSSLSSSDVRQGMINVGNLEVAEPHGGILQARRRWLELYWRYIRAVACINAKYNWTADWYCVNQLKYYLYVQTSKRTGLYTIEKGRSYSAQQLQAFYMCQEGVDYIRSAFTDEELIQLFTGHD